MLISWVFPGNITCDSLLYPTKEKLIMQEVELVDMEYLPLRSVRVPVDVFSRTMVTNGSGWPVSESVTNPVTTVLVVLCGKDLKAPQTLYKQKIIVYKISFFNFIVGLPCKIIFRSAILSKNGRIWCQAEKLYRIQPKSKYLLIKAGIQCQKYSYLSTQLC